MYDPGSPVLTRPRQWPSTCWHCERKTLRAQDLHDRPWTERYAALEQLAAGWVPALQLTPGSDDSTG